MATKSSQVAPWHEPGPLAGMAPVMSSRSTLRYDSACAEFVRAAVGIRRRFAAGRARSEAAIDAVAVAVVGDDEDALFRLRGALPTQRRGKNGDRDHGTHEIPPAGAGSAAKLALAINMKNATMELTLH